MMLGGKYPVHWTAKAALAAAGRRERLDCAVAFVIRAALGQRSVDHFGFQVVSMLDDGHRGEGSPCLFVLWCRPHGHFLVSLAIYRRMSALELERAGVLPEGSADAFARAGFPVPLFPLPEPDQEMRGH